MLVALGDAPNWTARAEGLKRLGRRPGRHGRSLAPLPRLAPRTSAAAARGRVAEVPVSRAAPGVAGAALALGPRQGTDPEALWDELRDLGLKPWVHRHVKGAAAPGRRRRPSPPRLRTRRAGDPGPRLAGRGPGLRPRPRRALVGRLRGGRRQGPAPGRIDGGQGARRRDRRQRRSKLKETVRRARRSPFRNLTTKDWDGKHVAGKAGSFQGVLVDAPCSAIGTWRRNPDARWTIARDDDRPPRRAPVADPPRRRRRRPARRHARLLGLHPHPGRDLRRHPDLPRRRTPTSSSTRSPTRSPATPTDGTLLIWPQESDNDAMFIARMVRSG